MLNNEVPLGVVHSVIEICNCNLHPPVVLVVELNMPMDTNWAHMTGTLNERLIIMFTRTFND